jgi:hypothetical protein
VVLGEVVGVEAKPVVQLGELEPLGELLGGRAAVVVDVVEDAELHLEMIYDRRPCAPRS